jgi:spermidine/putrescine transport system substrate-binding protein
MLWGCQAPEKTDSSKQLNIYSWADYLFPGMIENFERRFGIKVVYDTFSSNEALIAKFEAGAADYDIIVPTMYGVTKLRQLKHLGRIDHDRLPNYKNIMPRFTKMAFDPGLNYSIPYTFGTTGIAYNKKAYDELAVKPPTDWHAFFDDRLKGRMTLLEDARETLGMAMKMRGHSFNSTQEPIVAQACKDMIVQKPLTMCYSTDQVIIYLASGDSRLSLAYSGDALQARRSNEDIEYIIPASGASMWIDNMCIPASAPHVDNAHLWINYVLEPEVSAALSNFTYYPTPNLAAAKFVKPELLNNKSLYLPESVLDKCEEIEDVGDAIFIYDRLWTELKCA